MKLLQMTTYVKRIYVKSIKNRIVFKIKTGYKLELLSNETVTLLGDGPIIDKDKNSSNVPKVEVVTTVLMHCNLVQNNYQQASKLLYAFVPDKSFNQLIRIHPSSLIKLKTTDSEFNFTNVCFTDQSYRPLQIEDSVNITIIIQTYHLNYLSSLHIIKMRYSVQPSYRKYVKGYGFLSFAKKIWK